MGWPAYWSGLVLGTVGGAMPGNLTQVPGRKGSEPADVVGTDPLGDGDPDVHDEELLGHAVITAG